MVSEHFDPRQQMVWSDSVGWYTPSRIPNPCRSLAADRPSSLSGYGGGPYRCMAKADRPSSLSGYGGGPYRQEMGVIGLGSSACKIPSRFQSESAFEPYLPRQIPDSSDLRRRRGPAELALAVSGPDRREVKVPHSTPGKIPNPSSDLGKMKEWVVSYEEDATDPTAVWRILHLRPSEEPRKVPDQIQPRKMELEMARRVEYPRQSNLNSTQEKQWMGAPEGNFNPPPTGHSAVPSGWGQNQLPPACLVCPNLNHLNPSHGPELAKQCSQYPRKLRNQFQFQDQSKQWDPNPSNKRVLRVSTVDDDLSYSNNMKIEQMEQTKVKAKLCSVEYQPRRVPGKEILEQEAEEKQGVYESGDEDEINKGIAVKTNFVMANVPDEAKFYLTQLYMVGRDDRWLWSTGLLWKPPPWPDLGARGCDIVAKNGGYEVLVNFHSVKRYHISLDNAFEFNDYCRSHQHPISLIKAEVCGLLGSVLCDVGPEITVLDVDGEDPQTGITDNPALVSCDDDEADFHMKQDAFLYNLGAQMLPKSYHCFSRRLMLEYSKFSSLDSDEHFACKFNNPKHRNTYEQVYAHVLNYEAILWEKLPKFSMQQLNFVGLLWTLPPWPDLNFCEVNWMAIGLDKGAGAVLKKEVYHDVTEQSKTCFQQAKSKPPLDTAVQKKDTTLKPFIPGVCKYCGDKWFLGHKCKQYQQVNLMVGEGEVVIPETSEQEEGQPPPQSDSEAQLMQISTQAVRGVTGISTYTLEVNIGGKIGRALVDSGSTHTYIDLTFVTQITCNIQIIPLQKVAVAGGGTLWVGSYIPAANYCIRGESFNNSFKVLPLKGYDVVLGCDWLYQHSPVTLDLKTRRLIIKKYGVTEAVFEEQQPPPLVRVLNLKSWDKAYNLIRGMIDLRAQNDKPRLLGSVNRVEIQAPESALDDIYATAIKHCDPEGYLMLYVPKMIPGSDMGAENEELVKAATTENKVQFIKTNDRDMARILFRGIALEEQFLGIAKSEPEKFGKCDGVFEEEAIIQFVDLNKFPLNTAFTELNFAKVYASPIKLQVFTFAEAYDFEDLESMLQEVATGVRVSIMGANYVLGQKKDLYVKSVQRTDIWMGKTQESVEYVSCGNTVAMDGLDQFLTTNATLTNVKGLGNQNRTEKLDITDNSKFAAGGKQSLKELDNYNSLEELDDYSCPKEFDSTEGSEFAAVAHTDDFLDEQFNIRESGKDALIRTSETGSVKKSIALQSKDSSKQTSVPAEQVFDAGLIRTMKSSVSPGVRVAVQCQVVSALPKLVEGLKHLAKFDSTVLCTLEESDEHITAGAGGLHPEIGFKNLLKKSGEDVAAGSSHLQCSSLPRINFQGIFPESYAKTNKSWVLIQYLRTSIILRRRECQNLKDYFRCVAVYFEGDTASSVQSITSNGQDGSRSTVCSSCVNACFS